MKIISAFGWSSFGDPYGIPKNLLCTGYFTDEGNDKNDFCFPMLMTEIELIKYIKNYKRKLKIKIIKLHK